MLFEGTQELEGVQEGEFGFGGVEVGVVVEFVIGALVDMLDDVQVLVEPELVLEGVQVEPVEALFDWVQTFEVVQAEFALLDCVQVEPPELLFD